MKKYNINVVHNKDGYDVYNKEAFEFASPFIISFIKNITNKIGALPRINETLVIVVAPNTDAEDIAVYYIKNIEYYDFMILFVLDEERETELYR